ncbi:MAG: hypothetical protein IPH86_07275 [bacterium]|nr:hypothetical protein [bacterium]
MMAFSAQAPDARAAAPVVDNVVLAQRVDGSRILDVTYDVADAEGDPLFISLQLSADGGATWGFPPLNASGHIGAGVTPGTRRAIQLDYSAVPDPILIEQMRARVIASDKGVSFAPRSPGNNIAVLQLNPSNWQDPAQLEKLAQADLLVVTADELWAGSALANVPVIQNLKAINPDLKVVGYVSAFTSRLSGANSPPGSFWQQWYTRLRPYWVYTTAGDTSMTWPGAVVVNTLNPDCRRVMVETIVEFQRNSLNQLDGVYWDYFNTALWVYPELTIEGDPDMDGDGIAHLSDPDELAAYRAGEVALVTALRDSLGEDYIQIFNGQRAYGEPSFAALADGLVYENYPTLFFPQPNARNSMDPAYAYNLFNVRNSLRTQNGGLWMILSNVWINRYSTTTAWSPWSRPATSSVWWPCSWTATRPGIPRTVPPSATHTVGPPTASAWVSPSGRQSTTATSSVVTSSTAGWNWNGRRAATRTPSVRRSGRWANWWRNCESRTTSPRAPANLGRRCAAGTTAAPVHRGTAAASTPGDSPHAARTPSAGTLPACRSALPPGTGTPGRRLPAAPARRYRP